ncbi:MAG: DNA/RNA non-specific endonuclease [Bacteroidaceae bacterium]|nr:DNA/RNA non-specific endonuclease [Bacteroidaceae bacterium]
MQRLASNTRRRIPTTSISLILGLMLCFTACNDDEDEFFFGDKTNTNSNTVMVGTTPVTYSNRSVVTCGFVNAVTEGSTDLQQAACRLEVPKLKGGSNNLFIVHTVGSEINYCIEWNCNLRAQYWSAFRWDKTNSGGSASGSLDDFTEDPLIPINDRSTLEDHKSNGYQRGHMLANADRKNSTAANKQTYYLSNIHPQWGNFNGQGIWWNLEKHIRDVYNTNAFRDTLYVVKGGTISAGNYTIVKGLPVPKYFFMALLCKKLSDTTQGGYKAIAFWMEHKSNTDSNYKKYAISIDELEQKTGIDFFPNLPDNIERVVESNLVLPAWKLY